MDQRSKIQELPSSIADSKLQPSKVVRAVQANFDHLMGALRALSRAHNATVDDVEDIAATVNTLNFEIGDKLDIDDAITDHGDLTGLGDDDHSQYLKEKASGGSASEIPVHTHASSSEAGTVSHDDLTGVSANDHHNQTHGNADHTTAYTDDTTVNAHIADTTDAHDASAVSIVDAGGYYTGTDVEAALQEIGAGGIGGGGGGGYAFPWFMG
jgi:hypothetical protein